MRKEKKLRKVKSTSCDLDNWPLHSLVNKDSQSFDSQPIFLCKLF